MLGDQYEGARTADTSLSQVHPLALQQRGQKGIFVCIDNWIRKRDLNWEKYVSTLIWFFGKNMVGICLKSTSHWSRVYSLSCGLIISNLTHLCLWIISLFCLNFSSNFVNTRTFCLHVFHLMTFLKAALWLAAKLLAQWHQPMRVQLLKSAWLATSCLFPWNFFISGHYLPF